MEEKIIDLFLQLIILYCFTFLTGGTIVFIIKKYFPGSIEKLSAFGKKKAVIIIFCIILAYIIFFSIFSIVRYEAFVPATFDLGNMEQAAWNTTRGDILRMTTYYPAETRMFFHIEPIFLVIAPFFSLWTNPKMLLIIQTIILAFGALPVFLIATEKLKSNLAGVLLAGAYLLNPALQQANISDFHPLVLAPTFILFAFYFLIKSSYKTSLVFFILAAFCREEIAIMVFLFGIYIFFFKNKKWGAAIGLFGLAWAIIALAFLIPLFSPTGAPLQYEKYSRFGDTPIEIIKYIVTHPFSIFELYHGLGQLNYLFFLLIPLALTPLFSPALLLTGAFSFMVVFLSDFAGLQAGLHQYSAPLVAPIFIAGIFGLSRLAKRIKKWPSQTTITLVVIVIFLINLQLMILHQWTPLSFTSKLLTDYNAPKIVAAKEAIKLIPDDASLVASWRLGPHVANRKNLYLIDTPYRFSADYIFINRYPDVLCYERHEGAKFCEATAEDYATYLADIENNENYLLIFEQEHVLLFKKINSKN